MADIEKLAGEVFSDGGRVGIAIPRAGVDGAIPFIIVKVHPAELDGGSPAWADLLLGGKAVRINPDICQPPFHRLADCLMVAHHQREKLPTGDTKAKLTLPPAPHPEAQDFVFWKESIGGVEVVLIDRMDRIGQYTLKAEDGQHRHGTGARRRFRK